MEQYFHVDHARRTLRIQTWKRNHKRLQNQVISKKDELTIFHWKRSFVMLECRLQINLAAKTTWRESLTCSTTIHWYISSLESQDSSCYATTEGPGGKSNCRVVSSCCVTECEETASSLEKSREVRSSDFSRSPDISVWSSWLTTL